jgi:hypothetical protein
MYDIETIQVMYSKRAVEVTQHFHDRIKERGIKHADVANAIMNGEIIEQVLDDYPNPSILVLGYDRDSKPLHIAIGVDDDRLWMITAYYPTSDIWEADYKTRKAAE